MERTGAVTLVGAGCGRDLITVKGLCALQQADVVVYDDLIDKNLLLETRPECERIYVGKRMGKHSHGQEEIHRLLALKAGAGKRVVRLKGGDSFVFGRGGEEILYLQKKGIAYEVIPGVSSFLAAAAAMKREYTLPGVSQTVILTRMEGRTPVPESEQIAKLAAHQATMVIFLSVGRIGQLCEQLRQGGYHEDTPAAAVYKASWKDQKIVCGTLKDLAGKVQEAGIRKTALVMVGGFLGDEFEKSKLYDPGFGHEYRREEGKN